LYHCQLGLCKGSASLIKTSSLSGNELPPTSTGEQLRIKSSHLPLLPSSPDNLLTGTPAQREQEQLSRAPSGRFRAVGVPVDSYRARRWHSTTRSTTPGLCVPQTLLRCLASPPPSASAGLDQAAGGDAQQPLPGTCSGPRLPAAPLRNLQLSLTQSPSFFME